MSRTDPTRSLPAAASRRRAPGPNALPAPSEDARAELARRDRDDMQFAVAWFGAHRICPNRGCQRAGRCLDDDPAVVPLCFRRHRRTILLTMAFFAAEFGLEPRDPAEIGERKPHSGVSLLDALSAAGEPLERFRRPTGDRDGDHDWASEAEAEAELAEVWPGAAPRPIG